MRHGVGRHREGAAGGAGGTPPVESAGLHRGRAPYRGRPPLRRRSRHGDEGGTPEAGARGGQGSDTEEPGDPPDAPGPALRPACRAGDGRPGGHHSAGRALRGDRRAAGGVLRGRGVVHRRLRPFRRRAGGHGDHGCSDAAIAGGAGTRGVGVAGLLHERAAGLSPVHAARRVAGPGSTPGAAFRRPRGDSPLASQAGAGPDLDPQAGSAGTAPALRRGAPAAGRIHTHPPGGVGFFAGRSVNRFLSIIAP